MRMLVTYEKRYGKDTSCFQIQEEDRAGNATMKDEETQLVLHQARQQGVDRTAVL